MKIRDKRTYERGLFFNSKGFVVAGDFYNTGTLKYNNKRENYSASRNLKVQ